MLHGEYGIEDVCLSLLNVVGSKEVQGKIMLSLTDDELKALHNSAACLKEIIKQTKI